MGGNRRSLRRTDHGALDKAWTCLSQKGSHTGTGATNGARCPTDPGQLLRSPRGQRRASSTASSLSIRKPWPLPAPATSVHEIPAALDVQRKPESWVVFPTLRTGTWSLGSGQFWKQASGTFAPSGYSVRKTEQRLTWPFSFSSAEWVGGSGSVPHTARKE